MADVNYTPAISIVDLPITNPIHAPCPDMAGMVNPDPNKLKRSRILLQNLRITLGLDRRKTASTEIPERFLQASFATQEEVDFHGYEVVKQRGETA